MKVAITGIGLALGGVRDLEDLRDGADREGEVDPIAVLGRRGLLYVDRATQLALCAAQEALVSAGLLEESRLSVSGEAFGVLASSNLGNADTVCRAAQSIADEGTGVLSPMDLPNASCNVVASAISIRFGLRGPNFMLCNGGTGGLDAAYLGASMLRSGRACGIVVVGVETRNETVAHLLEVEASELLDGAVALILEPLARAEERGVEALGLLGPYGSDPDLDVCLAQVQQSTERPSTVWLVPEGFREPGPLSMEEVPRRDLSARFGRCSGALGVLQCAAGVAWLAYGEADRAIATAGGKDDEPFAALALTRSTNRPRAEGPIYVDD
jgi:3-oxoacyl-[acyl-carrier-protein] synthase II